MGMFAWYPEYEALFAQIQLVLFMLGMGANLKVEDFLLVLRRPRSFFIAAVGQVLFLPFLAVGINHLFGLEGGFAVGLIVVAAMPGGALSKLFTFLGKGNVPLSITLSGFTSLATIVFVPLWLHLLASEYVPEDFSVPAGRVVMDVTLFLLMPLVAGMVFGGYFPLYRTLFAKVCLRVGLLFVLLMVVGSLASGRIEPAEHGFRVPLAIILFCVLGQQLILVPFYLLRLPRADRLAAGIESTMRNINLALLIYAEFFKDTPLGKGVLFIALFYAATAMIAGLPMVLRHRQLGKREERSETMEMEGQETGSKIEN